MMEMDKGAKSGLNFIVRTYVFRPSAKIKTAISFFSTFGKKYGRRSRKSGDKINKWPYNKCKWFKFH